MTLLTDGFTPMAHWTRWSSLWVTTAEFFQTRDSYNSTLLTMAVFFCTMGTGFCAAVVLCSTYLLNA
jgi:hypothetical protein